MGLSEAARDCLRTTAIALAVIIAGAFAIGLARAIDMVLGVILAMFGLPLVAAVLLIAAGVLLVQGVLGAIDADTGTDRAVLLLAGPVLLAGGGVMLFVALAAGAYFGDLGKLTIKHGRYEAIVARVRASGGADRRAEHDGIRYRVDPGPPLRIAFDAGGVADNWSGTVYDPTGEVMLARGVDPASGPAAPPARITELFGGDLVGCSHLWGDYYSCSFT